MRLEKLRGPKHEGMLKNNYLISSVKSNILIEVARAGNSIRSYVWILHSCWSSRSIIHVSLCMLASSSPQFLLLLLFFSRISRTRLDPWLASLFTARQKAYHGCHFWSTEKSLAAGRRAVLVRAIEEFSDWMLGIGETSRFIKRVLFLPTFSLPFPQVLHRVDGDMDRILVQFQTVVAPCPALDWCIWSFLPGTISVGS
jgi:hypothetical protein